jgi:hypothetical protein
MNRVVRSVGELGLKVARWEVVWRSGLRKKRAKEKKTKGQQPKTS